MQSCRLVSKTLLLSHNTQQVTLVSRSHTSALSTYQQYKTTEDGVLMVLLVLMVVLEMLQVFRTKSDEGNMLKPLTQRLYLLWFPPPPNQILQPFFYFFALPLGTLLTLQCPSPALALTGPRTLHTSEDGHSTARRHTSIPMCTWRKAKIAHFPKGAANHFCFSLFSNCWWVSHDVAPVNLHR